MKRGGMGCDADATRSFYSRRAASYAADTGDYSVSEHLTRFSALLAQDARVLELGCGSGRDSAWMLSKGFEVHPTDGIAEMAEQASARLGIPVAVLPFAQISALDSYDGVWANACLLHVPRHDLADILQRIQRALKPNGIFYASYKAGRGEGFDGLGRYYNYPDQDWLRLNYGRGWSSLEILAQQGGGYDGLPPCFCPESRWRRTGRLDPPRVNDDFGARVRIEGRLVPPSIDLRDRKSSLSKQICDGIEGRKAQRTAAHQSVAVCHGVDRVEGYLIALDVAVLVEDFHSALPQDMSARFCLFLRPGFPFTSRWIAAFKNKPCIWLKMSSDVPERLQRIVISQKHLKDMRCHDRELEALPEIEFCCDSLHPLHPRLAILRLGNGKHAGGGIDTCYLMTIGGKRQGQEPRTAANIQNAAG